MESADKKPIHQIVNLKWFKKYATVKPQNAFQVWDDWLKHSQRPNRSESTYYRKLLVVATGKKEATVRIYLDPRKSNHISEIVASQFDRITRSLGFPLPEHRQNKKTKYWGNKNKIALLTELSNLPSLHYHKEVIKGVTKAANEQKYTISLYEVSTDDLFEVIENVTYTYRPDVFILIRISVNEQIINFLTEENVPIVLINVEKGTYDFPIIGNIVPFAGEKVKCDFRKWIRNLPKQGGFSSRVVIASMAITDNYRKERFSLITSILEDEGIEVELVILEDYSFRHAIHIWEHYPNALGYICLSDPIAIALKHLHIAAGKSTFNRIIGFDNSMIASIEGISSFDQKLDKIGELTLERISEFFSQKNNNCFKETGIELEFKNRNTEVLEIK